MRATPDISGSGGLRRDAILSQCGLYRWLLTRVWDGTLPVVVFIMLNPSTADALSDDATIRRCIAFARAWGYGGISVVNLYGLRATDPRELWKHADPVGPKNDEHVVQAAAWPRLVVAAWGGNAKPERVREVRGLLRYGGVEMYHLGLTKSGAPRHPLYLRADVKPQRWAA